LMISSPNATFERVQRSRPESIMFVNWSLAAAHDRRSSNESHRTTSHTRLSISKTSIPRCSGERWI